jgi:hypothetical protein
LSQGADELTRPGPARTRRRPATAQGLARRLGSSIESGTRRAARRSPDRERCAAAGGSSCPSPRSGHCAARCSLQRQDAGVEVNVPPPDAAQLPAPEARHHRHPDQPPPIRVLPGLGKNPRGFLGAGRLGARSRRQLCFRDRVCCEPTPAHGPIERTAEHKVDLPDCRCTERRADVRSTTRVALMGPLRAVLDIGAAVTVVPASTQLRMERVEHPCVEGPHRGAPDEGPDVLVRVPDVGAMVERSSVNSSKC